LTCFFAATLFVSAGLLFLMQPMIAKMILPLAGGAPEVWNTCMVFFQSALLAGYAYAHLLASRVRAGRQAIIHLAVLLLAAIVLPLGVRDWAPPGDASPVPALLTLLATCVGLPFFAVAATAPLLQRWFADSGRASARDPYFLYGASNAGSVLALLSYPAFLEPSLRLADQSRIWTAGYAVLILLIGGCAFLTARSRRLAPAGSNDLSLGQNGCGKAAESEAAAQRSPFFPVNKSGEMEAGIRAPTLGRRLRWVALAFVPSSIMLGATTYITTDISPVPLLWIMPLTLYLLSFILTFARLPRWVHVLMLWLLPTSILVLVFARLSGLSLPITQVIAIYLTTFFVAAMVCHGELAHSRPATPYLTEFYLWVALGGVLGGAFNAIVAPQIFNRIVEYPLAIVWPCFLLVRLGRPRNTSEKEMNVGTRAGRFLGHDAGAPLYLGGLSWGWVVFGVVMGILCLPAVGFHHERTLYLGRSFFGVLRVETSANGAFHELAHGRILHGTQSWDPKLREEPLSYYDREGPIGQVFQAIKGLGQRKIGVMGLGAGTIAAYAEPGAELTFYEIDPAVERVARDPRYFTYLTDCEERNVKLNVVIGDARLQMAKSAGSYGLIVLDAFSSDAVPVHTLTREAFQMYLNKLSEDGVILVNMTNRYLDLAPVVGAQAEKANLIGLHQVDDPSLFTVAQSARRRQGSHWAVLARRPERMAGLLKDERWQVLSSRSGEAAWTDDFSNLLSVFKWNADGW
jgi:hypothetical protein